MNRLTWRDANGVAQLGKKSRSSLSLTTREAIDKLAAYEDIGLSPGVLADIAEILITELKEDSVNERTNTTKAQ